MTEHFIDGDLLVKANRGDKGARQLLTRYAADAIRPLARQDEAVAWLLPILEKIANGVAPDTAFPKKGRGPPIQNLEYERWTMARWVKTLHDDYALTIEEAEDKVAEHYPDPGTGKAMGGSEKGTVNNAWDAYKDVEMLPMDAIITTEAIARVSAFERRMEQYLATLPAKMGK